MMEKFVSVQPKSEIIRKYIAYYYFHSCTDTKFEKSFVFYPNYKNALTVYKNAEILLSEEGTTVSDSKTKQLRVLYTTNLDKSIRVRFKGAFDKIGIVFAPLGFNHFVDKPLFEVLSERVGYFDYFGLSFKECITAVFEESEESEKARLLDSFFENRLADFDVPILEKAVDEIITSGGLAKVSELSEKLTTNRKTLLRLFQKHLLCSVEEYKKMVRFRQAINFSQEQNGANTLTEIALFSQYYDQADFIRQFKSITKESPKKVIPSISKLGDETYWKLE
ncbi:AraC-like DNA-binding protein [Flavobacterium sp. 28YEA47A]|uniref:helix-turn-helix domain-containing protein n=1 Tax=Flavobacterium sp. 28YEA47A TaxID=3156276 RepID=UPI00351914F6